MNELTLPREKVYLKFVYDYLLNCVNVLSKLLTLNGSDRLEIKPPLMPISLNQFDRNSSHAAVKYGTFGTINLSN